ncbi:MAG: hypothetical protein IJC70_03580 [Firmicutes bacterium]|nr:hypothetical protein [Bacillota bacterium]
MSSLIYLASAAPIAPRPNPHDRMVSVNEALALGVKVHYFMLAPGFDRDKPGVLLVADREVIFDVDNKRVIDGDHDDDFGFFPLTGGEDIRTKLPHLLEFEMMRYTEGRAREIIRLFGTWLQDAEELEFWHIYMGMEEALVRWREVRYDALTEEDIRWVVEAEVGYPDVPQHCLRIYK